MSAEKLSTNNAMDKKDTKKTLTISSNLKRNYSSNFILVEKNHFQ